MADASQLHRPCEPHGRRPNHGDHLSLRSSWHAGAWFVGDIDDPMAVAFDPAFGGDLHGFGSAEGLAAIASAHPDWHSFSVAPTLADAFGGTTSAPPNPGCGVSMTSTTYS